MWTKFFVRVDPESIHHSAFLNSCLQGVESIFSPLPPSQTTFTFQAKTSYWPRGPWCAQNKFNICHHIKWLCSPANEKPQTFENCLATLPACKKLSVTSFFRRISLLPSLPLYYPFCTLPLFLFFLYCIFLFLSLTLPLFNLCNVAWASSPFVATEIELICFTQRNGWCCASSQILNRVPGCVGCRLAGGCFVWIRETCVAFSCK